MSQAFAGIRILDFSQVLAAPFGVQQLAMLGADVIKIEQPGSGDMTRGLMNSSGDGMSPSFMTCNLNKRSITVDLKQPAATDIVHKLVQHCDAVVENMRPGVMERLGFGYATLRQIKSDLVYCSVSGYGQTGPKASLPAFDGAIQASSGMMSLSGHPETGPVRAGYFAVDMATSLNMAFALSAALFRRQATGLGQHVDVAMMDTAVAMQGPQFSAHFVKGTIPTLLGNQSPTRNPTANVFTTADGYIQIIALKQAQVEALFQVLGIEQQLHQAQFATVRARIENYSAVADLVSPIIAEQSTSHWLEKFGAASVPAATIRTLDEVVADPQFSHRDIFVPVPDPNTTDPAAQMTQVVGGSHAANQDGPLLRNPAPALGADTDDVLTELGYSAAQIQGFRSAGAI